VPHLVALSPGDNEITGFAIDWRADFIDAIPPQAELIASIQSDPTPRIYPNQVRTATTLAIRMDAQVAIELYRRIALLAARMGWQLPP
jgi:hypothetical protein